MDILQKHEQYVQRVKEIHGDRITVLGQYAGCNAKILHECIKGHQWLAMPSQVGSRTKRTGCPECYKAPRKTPDEYKREVASVHDGWIQPIENYINAHTSILHECSKNHQWKASPTNILGGAGCAICKGVKKRSQQEYIDLVKSVHGDRIIVVGEYKSLHKPLLHRCTAAGHEWMGTPSFIKTGGGCPYCSGMRKKTPEEYVEALNKKYGDRIKAIEPYKGANVKILHECDKGHQWSATPGFLLSKSSSVGCLKCSGRAPKTHEEYCEEVKAVHGSKVVVLGQYVNCETKIMHKCQVGHVWNTTPSSVARQKTGCPYCAGQKSDKLIKANRVASQRMRNRIYDYVMSGGQRESDNSLTKYVRSVLAHPDIASDVPKIASLYESAAYMNSLFSKELQVAVDHIIPLCFADVMNPSELILISLSKNLRIITKTENDHRRHILTKQDIFNLDLFTNWHLFAILQLSYARYYCPKIESWISERLKYEKREAA